MSIKLVVTRGFGNGTFNGTIKDTVVRGYTMGVAPTGGMLGSIVHKGGQVGKGGIIGKHGGVVGS